MMIPNALGYCKNSHRLLRTGQRVSPSHRAQVEVEEAHHNFADDARANRSEPTATAPSISLPLEAASAG